MKLFTKNGRFLRKMWKQDCLGIVFSYINKSNIFKKGNSRIGYHV